MTRPRRSGFTLLEVLLASVIALLLMGALYAALNSQLRLAEEGRNVVEQSTLIRAVANRMTQDLSMSLAPITAVKATSATSSSTSTSTTTSSTSTTGTTDSSASSSTTTDSADQVVVTAIPLSAGIVGTSSTLTIYGSRVPDLTSSQPTADLRRITYWMTENGLARQESPWLLADNIRGSSDPVTENGKEEGDYVISKEVKSLSFEYYDPAGSGWTDSWDGATLGADGLTPQGPPAAIRITVILPDPSGKDKEYRHVIAVRTAPGTGAPPAPTTTDDTGSTTP